MIFVFLNDGKYRRIRANFSSSRTSTSKLSASQISDSFNVFFFSVSMSTICISKRVFATVFNDFLISHISGIRFRILFNIQKRTNMNVVHIIGNKKPDQIKHFRILFNTKIAFIMSN